MGALAVDSEDYTAYFANVYLVLSLASLLLQQAGRPRIERTGQERSDLHISGRS